jgi:hypothetical protein
VLVGAAGIETRGSGVGSGGAGRGFLVLRVQQRQTGHEHRDPHGPSSVTSRLPIHDSRTPACHRFSWGTKLRRFGPT